MMTPERLTGPIDSDPGIRFSTKTNYIPGSIEFFLNGVKQPETFVVNEIDARTFEVMSPVNLSDVSYVYYDVETVVSGNREIIFGESNILDKQGESFMPIVLNKLDLNKIYDFGFVNNKWYGASSRLSIVEYDDATQNIGETFATIVFPGVLRTKNTMKFIQGHVQSKEVPVVLKMDFDFILDSMAFFTTEKNNMKIVYDKGPGEQRNELVLKNPAMDITTSASLMFFIDNLGNMYELRDESGTMLKYSESMKKGILTENINLL